MGSRSMRGKVICLRSTARGNGIFAMDVKDSQISNLQQLCICVQDCQELHMKLCGS